MGNAKSGHNLSGSRVGTSPKPGFGTESRRHAQSK
jgi:hypothetical protein